ncbi:MAG: hypothetical protein FWC32_06270 [Firmicutes bacterium]|nr:hypothetical protein [Bacillota bacterium]
MSELNKMEKAANIDNTIKLLDGELQETVQNFVDFFRANDIEMGYNPDEYAEGVWRGAFVSGYMAVNSLDYMAADTEPKSMMVWLWVDDLDENTLDNEVKESVWTAASCKKDKCNDDWEKCCVSKTILGKTIENACCNQLMFVNPDGKTLENMKKLILALKQREDEPAAEE